MELTKQNFSATITGGKPVLVDFWAPWCGPCRAQGPILEEAAKELGDTAIVGKVNVDEQPEIAQQYGVMSIPTLIVFKGGAAVSKLVGLTQKARLVETVKAHI